ncbi:MAG TPA: MMPL family transporter [Streptosporangiaceae bacterium]|nr:MMPL family transporter [Streptosporangiaceae bacterium]
MSILRGVTAAPAHRRAKWLVLVLWLVLAAVVAPLSGKLTGAEKNDASSWLPAKAESTQVLNLRSRSVSPNVFAAIIVYDRASGLTGGDKAKIASDAEQYRAVPGAQASQIQGPSFAKDGTAAETIVPVDLGSKGWNGASDAAKKIRAIADASAGGMAVHIAGPLGVASDSANSFKGINGALLFGALAVVIVLLLFTYRSPVLWILPVVSAVIALTTSQGLIYVLAKHGLTVNAQSAGILDVLVFGAGTDYALLLTARYREELRKHTDRHEAMRVAIHRAGPAIVASAGTVIVSLLTLSFASLNSTKGLGPVLAIGVVVALIAMMTLLPALLVICGRWVFWPAKPRYGSDEPTARGLWSRVGQAVGRRPRAVWLGTVVVLGVMAIGLTGLKASGLTTAESFRGSTPDSVTGQTVLDKHFPAGSGQPVQIYANASQGVAVEAALKSMPGITDVTPPVTDQGRAFILATLTSAPDSSTAYQTIDKIRTTVHAVPGANAEVGGSTAINLDVQRASAHDRNLIIPIILLVVFLILGLLLRAIIAPIMLIATVVLSFAAALGVSSLFFDHVFNFGNADSGFPLFVFVFLVALGIDYNIFLMTRVREETERSGPRIGALTGLSATGGVITSAGAVLAGTFAVLGTLPVTFLTELGFAVAFGVLLDTLVVRSVLVTALNLDLGRWVWWPSKLSRQPELEVDEDQLVVS